MQHIPTRRETEIHTTQVFSDVLPFSLLCELTITCVPSMNNSFTIYYLTSVNIKRPLVTRGYSFDFENERLIEALLCFPTRHFKIVSFYPFTLTLPFSNFHAKILLSLVTAICCKLCRKHPGPGCSNIALSTYFTIQPSVSKKTRQLCELLDNDSLIYILNSLVQRDVSRRKNEGWRGGWWEPRNTCSSTC